MQHFSRKNQPPGWHTCRYAAWRKSFSALSDAEGRASADTAVRRWRRKVPCLRVRRVAAVRRQGECRCSPAGTPCPRRGAKGGKGTIWFPCPLLTPPNPPLRRDSLRSRSETGETEARFRASGRFWDAVMPQGYFAWFAAHNSARPFGAGRQRSAGKSFASIKRCALEHQTPLWAPRF